MQAASGKQSQIAKLEAWVTMSFLNYVVISEKWC
jgi:hypothetical protein